MILVTGAGGNVGAGVLAACRERGLQAIGADRSGGAHRVFDFSNRATWERAVEGCSGLFLLRPPPVSNVKETLNPFVDFARSRGVKHVVFLSVQGAETQPRIPHYAVEKHLETTGQDWTFLRPGFFAQNFSDAYRRDIVEDHRVYVPAGAGVVAFVDTRDLGLAAARVFEAPATHRGQAYRLTGPTTFSFTEAATLLSEATGRKIRYVPASIGGYLWHAVTRRKAAAMQAIIWTVLHVGLRRGDAAIVDPTLSQLIERPARDLATFVSDSRAVWTP